MIKNKIFSILNRFTWIIDFVIGLFLFFELKDSTNTVLKIIAIVGLVYAGFILYRFIRALIKVKKSKTDALDYLANNRVMPITGKQRCGKSSFGCYLCKVGKTPVYSNVPLRLNGKYTNRLTTDILNIKKAVQENSILFLDEANLFYHNTMTEDQNDLFGQAVLGQCVGHFFDGNLIYVSVDTNRLPAIIRSNYSCITQVLESKSYHYSYIGSLLLFLVSFCMKNPIKYSGLRVWSVQHYEKVMAPSYISLLGQAEEVNGFAPLVEYSAFNTYGDEYDDRFMKFFYDDIIRNEDKEWNKLSLDYMAFKELYDGAVIQYLNKIHVEEAKEFPKIKIKKEDENDKSRNS